MKLYEITAEYRAALAEVEAAEGEMTPELEARLDAIGDTWQDKAENCAKAHRNLCAEAEALAAEERRLYERRQSLVKQGERLKAYILCQLTAFGEQKVKTPLFTIYRQKGRPVVTVLDETLIPDEYVQVERKPLKADILKYWKATDTVVPGVEIADGGESLVIR